MESDALVLKKNVVGQQFKLSKRNWEKNGVALHENLYHNAHSVFPSFPDTLLYLMNLLLLRRMSFIVVVCCLPSTYLSSWSRDSESEQEARHQDASLSKLVLPRDIR